MSDVGSGPLVFNPARPRELRQPLRLAFMNKFRKLGFIDYSGDLTVHNSLLNLILHGAPGLRREPEDA